MFATLRTYSRRSRPAAPAAAAAGGAGAGSGSGSGGAGSGGGGGGSSLDGGRHVRGRPQHTPAAAAPVLEVRVEDVLSSQDALLDDFYSRAHTDGGAPATAPSEMPPSPAGPRSLLSAASGAGAACSPPRSGVDELCGSCAADETAARPAAVEELDDSPFFSFAAPHPGSRRTSPLRASPGRKRKRPAPPAGAAAASAAAQGSGSLFLFTLYRDRSEQPKSVLQWQDDSRSDALLEDLEYDLEGLGPSNDLSVRQSAAFGLVRLCSVSAAQLGSHVRSRADGASCSEAALWGLLLESLDADSFLARSAAAFACLFVQNDINAECLHRSGTELLLRLAGGRFAHADAPQEGRAKGRRAAATPPLRWAARLADLMGTAGGGCAGWRAADDTDARRLALHALVRGIGFSHVAQEAEVRDCLRRYGVLDFAASFLCAGAPTRPAPPPRSRAAACALPSTSSPSDDDDGGDVGDVCAVLRLLEAATFCHPENALYLLDHAESVARTVEIAGELAPPSSAAAPGQTSGAGQDPPSELAMRLLLNWTNRNTVGSARVAAAGAYAVCLRRLRTVFEGPSSSSSSSDAASVPAAPGAADATGVAEEDSLLYDAEVLTLALLVNLCECGDEHCRALCGSVPELQRGYYRARRRRSSSDVDSAAAEEDAPDVRVAYWALLFGFLAHEPTCARNLLGHSGTTPGGARAGLRTRSRTHPRGPARVGAHGSGAHIPADATADEDGDNIVPSGTGLLREFAKTLHGFVLAQVATQTLSREAFEGISGAIDALQRLIAQEEERKRG